MVLCGILLYDLNLFSWYFESELTVIKITILFFVLKK